MGKFHNYLSASLLVAAALGRAQFVETAANLKDLPEVPSEFNVSLFARDPLVRNPCSLAFDRRGRLFVGMGPQYRNPKPDTPPDSVCILQDEDADGNADKSHVFATGFNCIQGLAWHGRDLWVANAPDLTIVRDLDGDDVADEYVRVFTDLGNIEHGLHGLHWAPDGRLYMSKGNSKGLVIRDWKQDQPDRIAPKPFRDLWGVPGPSDAPDFPASKTFRAADYKSTYHDPRDDWGSMGGVLRCDDTGANLEVVARGFRNPYDVTFDDGFDWLGTDQDQNEGDRIIMPFYGAEFGWSHAWSPHWTGKDHLPTAPVSGPVFTGSGTGIVWADVPNWPEKCRKVWLINDWLLKSTQVYRPTWHGALLQPAGGAWESFVNGKESLFRPVDMKFGPDGALYILGWGRGYGVEWDKDGKMANEGRIFRIIPKGATKLPPSPQKPLDQFSVAELVSEFENVLPVRRIDAQDELVRRGQNVHAPLTKLLNDRNPDKLIETWALWTLGRSALPEGFFANTAKDASGSLNRRIQAIRILGYRKSGLLGDLLDPLLLDPEPRIRFAAIQAVHQAGLKGLAGELMSHAANETERISFYATWRALRDLASVNLLQQGLRAEKAGQRCVALLALIDLKKISTQELEPFSRDPDNAVKTVALLGLGRKSQAPEPAPATDGPAFPLATRIVAESGNNYTVALLSPGQRSHTDRPYKIKSVPDSVLGAQMIRTANEDDRSVGNEFLTFEIPLAVTVMVAHDVRQSTRPAWMQDFADTDLTVATDDSTFRLWAKDFPPSMVRLGGNCQQSHGGPRSQYFVVLQPKPLLPRSSPTQAAEALDALKNGNPARGEALFFISAACSACHRIGDRGTNFGPDLTNLGDRMEAKYIVQSMLEPSAVITEGFSAHSIDVGTKNYFGTLLSTGNVVKLALVGGEVVEIQADQISKHETLPVSPMPPQGALLGPQEVADISAWLLSQKSAKPLEASAASPVGTGLQFNVQDDRLLLLDSGKPLAEYVFRHRTILRPFFANVFTPTGERLTRAFPPVEGVDATDHADMHPGIWFGFGELSGQDFWRNKGRLEHVKFTTSPNVKDGQFNFVHLCRMMSADGNEMGLITFRVVVEKAPHGHSLTMDCTIEATTGDLVFGDQEEMGLGVRMATELTEKAGGRIFSSENRTSAADTWGRQAAWCCYAGKIREKNVGIGILPNVQNKTPCWWHNRDYGVFVANPFGRRAGNPDGRFVLDKGSALPLSFKLFLNHGLTMDELRRGLEGKSK